MPAPLVIGKKRKKRKQGRAAAAAGGPALGRVGAARAPSRLGQTRPLSRSLFLLLFYFPFSAS
jgi:hypothetical protein